MKRPAKLLAIPVFALASEVCLAQVADLSGVWKLNVEQSRWGSRPKVVSCMVTIEHREPEVRYFGTVVDASQELRHFDFSGTVDGRVHPVNTAFGEGTARLTRVDARTIRAELKSNDGRATQVITTSLSRDGKVLTRRLKLKDANGSASWTEVYWKQ
jgi:hypothetical protein